MANHKRKRPKNSRGGCLLCKWYKANGTKGTKKAKTRQDEKSSLNMKEYGDETD